MLERAVGYSTFSHGIRQLHITHSGRYIYFKILFEKLLSFKQGDNIDIFSYPALILCKKGYLIQSRVVVYRAR